jgi:ornithine cyclodeaminase/alanine dehydrogenase
MEIVEESSLKQHALKEVENPPKPGVHPQPDAFLHAMPAWLKKKNICGIKWVSGFPGNVSKGLPTIAGLIVLNDVNTGFPLAIMDGTYITAIRTAAVSGVSAKYLARKDSKVIGIAGLGVQGKFNLMALSISCPSLEKVKLFEKWDPSYENFMAEMPKTLPHLKFERVSSFEEMVTDSDIVVCSTGMLLETVFYEKWVKKGALVLPIHSRGWEKDTPLKMDKFLVDDWAQFSNFVGDLYALPEKPYAELGEVCLGKKKGRENDTERIINFNAGLAIHDIVVASEILKIANEKGVGQVLKLSDNPKLRYGLLPLK